MNLINKILKKVEEEAEQEERLYTLGVYRASEIGGCLRALQYATLKYDSEPNSPELHLLFRDGHLHHNAVRELMGKVGTLSSVEMTVSKRYNHNGQKFIITGTLDGEFNKKVFDVKSISTFRFKALDKQFPKEHMRYVVQLNIYMDIRGCKEGFFIFKDKNSSELKYIHLEYSPKLMKETLDNVANLHAACKSKKLLPRPYEMNSFYCKSCPFRMPCYNKPMEVKRWATDGSAEWHQKRHDQLGARLRASLDRKAK